MGRTISSSGGVSEKRATTKTSHKALNKTGFRSDTTAPLPAVLSLSSHKEHDSIAAIRIPHPAQLRECKMLLL
jgi:hypothetical protein